MRLNHGCVRKVLLFIEENNVFEIDKRGKNVLVEITLNKLTLSDKLAKYSQDDIYYTVLKLFEGGYVDGWKIPDNGRENEIQSCVIRSITLRGHDLVDNIREEPIWTETKKWISKAGSVSLSVMSQIAGTVAAEYTKKLMGV